jgi:hypothetical protein
MFDYMVLDHLWHDYIVFQTEEEARDYVANQLADNGDYSESDLIIFKRERLA